VYLLVFIQNLLVHLAEKILVLQPLTFGAGDYPGIEWKITDESGMLSVWVGMGYGK